MKVSLNASDLLRGLKAVRGAVESRTTIPILSNVLLSAGNDGLALRATDMDIVISAVVAAEVEVAGDITVMADTFFSFVSKLGKDAVVKIEAEDTSLKISSGRTRATLHTLPAVDFPDLPTDDMQSHFTISSVELKKLFGRAQFAISSEETRYYLNGVFVHIQKDGNKTLLRAVATDGHRLAVIDVPAPEGAGTIASIIVPKKTVAEVLKLADGCDVVGVSASSAKIAFDFSSAQLVSKLIDATYPDYQRVVPTDNVRIATIDRAAFAACVDRISTVATKVSRTSKLAFVDGQLTVSMRNPDAGDASEDIEVAYASGPFEIGFNSRYLNDILDEITTKDVSVAMGSDPGSPALIRGLDEVDCSFVIMPMRI